MVYSQMGSLECLSGITSLGTICLSLRLFLAIFVFNYFDLHHIQGSLRWLFTVSKGNDANRLSLRAHIMRHERMFRCDIPGCTNTKGFARIDQLERHKRD